MRLYAQSLLRWSGGFRMPFYYVGCEHPVVRSTVLNYYFTSKKLKAEEFILFF